MNEQLVLFPTETGNDNFDLEVYKVSFLDKKYTNYKELFKGFSHLKVVTFSYGLDFIEEIAKYFDTVDIILGCPGIVKYSMKEIMAFQEKTLILLNKHRSLIERVVSGDVEISVLKELVSHEKFFILTDDFEKCRIISGSANFSGKAFMGKQRENILCFEDDELAFDCYMDEFEFLKEFACNKVVIDSAYNDSNGNNDLRLEELPLFKDEKVKDVGIIVDNDNTNSEEIDFITDVTSLADKKYSKFNIKSEKKGKTTRITPEHIHHLIRQEKEITKAETEKRKAYPRFNISYNPLKFDFNGKDYNLEVDTSTVEKDLQYINIFFDGFKSFIGYNEQNMIEYYKLLNYMFLSPFLAKFRAVAHITGYSEEFFPYYAVLNGKKSSGKSTLVETIHRMMFGKSLGKISPDIFVKTRMCGYLTEATGVPCLIDDIGRERYNGGADFIKSDEWLRKEKYENHPTFVLTSNEITTITPELAKRVIYLSVDMTQENVSAVLKKKKMFENRKNITTAFYKEYLYRITPYIEEMIEIMEKSLVREEQEIKETLDIFKISSKVIYDIYSDYNIEPPQFFKVVTYDDYFGFNSIMIKIKEKILLDWKHNKSAFKVFRKTNALEYSACERQYEADRIVGSLPEKLEARRSGSKVVMKLDEAENFFGVKFKNKNWFV